MKPYLGYESAIAYWRAVGSGLAEIPLPTPITCVADEMTSAKQILSSLPEVGLSNWLPAHVLVSRMSRLYVADGVIYHLCSRNLPPGSFSQLPNGTVIASPALCLLHAAQHSKPDRMLPLIELCFEFLGCYSLRSDVPRGFVNHDPFLDPVTARSFLEQLPSRTRGSRLLEEALSYALPNSNSPRETDATLMLTLPEELGGFGFPPPTLNYEVALSAHDRLFTDKERFYLDLYWEDTGVAFEYDGSDHAEPARIAEDKARRNLLAAKGFRLVVMEGEHAANARQFNQQVALLAKMLGIALRKVPGDIADKRTRLRRHLFNPLHYGSSPLTMPISAAPVNAASASAVPDDVDFGSTGA